MAVSGLSATAADEGAGKVPRTDRGRRTQRALLDAAAAEFGEKGFHDSSIVSITARAGVALGTFYTYFDSKEALFRALVGDISDQVRASVAGLLAEPAGDTLARERKAFVAFLAFARQHKELYRIIDEAEFVANREWRAHYENAAQRILERLRDGEAKGELAGPIDEAHAWAIMGMNVFLGLRYGVQQPERPLDEVAAIANGLIARGLAR
jgi:AcrR family transcriptional regulator